MGWHKVLMAVVISPISMDFNCQHCALQAEICVFPPNLLVLSPDFYIYFIGLSHVRMGEAFTQNRSISMAHLNVRGCGSRLYMKDLSTIKEHFI